MDKGFHSPTNQTMLKERPQQVVLPEKAAFPTPIRRVNPIRNMDVCAASIQR